MSTENRISDPRIATKFISPSALQVINRLHDAGFEAYVVGGCVRDLLLEITPKDFDVVTNADPYEICEIFSKSRLVGRRFVLAHVREMGEKIEVSTFRSTRQDIGKSGIENKVGRHLANVDQKSFGSIDEDVLQRDFTINALYFDVKSEQIIDFVDGMADVDLKKLRTIGDPIERFHEDPVRMLRAIRFAAKLGLIFEESLERAMQPSREHLTRVSRARLYGELEKLFLCGKGVLAYEMVQQLALDEVILPFTYIAHDLVYESLASSDERIAIGKPVTSMFVFATLLWQEYQTSLVCADNEESYFVREQQAAKKVINELRQTIGVTRRHAHFMEDVWVLQGRLSCRSAHKIDKILAHRRFRAAYDLFVLRTKIGEVSPDIAAWWTSIQTLEDEERQREINLLHPSKRKRRRNNREKLYTTPPAVGMFDLNRN